MKTKMSYSHLIFSMIVICGITTGCAYYPRLTSVPLIKEKGDTRIEGGVGVFSQSLQAAFSQGATDKIAYQVSGSIDPYGPLNSNGTNTSRLYGQGAIGFYKNIQDRDVMELYGGFGCGRSEAYKDANPGNFYGNFQSYFLQFNYGYIEKNKVNLEAGIGLKTGLLHSKMTDANYFFRQDDYPSNGPYPIYHLNGLIFEPTAFLRLGGKKVKFWIAMGVSKYYQLNYTDKQLPVFPFDFGIGVSYSFGGHTRQKAKE